LPKSKKQDKIIANENSGKDIGEKTVRVASSIMLGRIVSLFLSAIAFVIIARVLGPSTYGVFTIAIAIATFFAAFGDLGVGTSFSKFVGQYAAKNDKDSIEKIFSNGYAIMLITGIFFTLLIFGLSNIIAHYVLGSVSYAYVIQIASFVILLTMIFSASYYAIIGFGKGKYLTLIIAIQYTIQALASILFVLMGLGAIAPLLGIILGYIAGLIIAAYVLYGKMGLRLRKPDLKSMRELLGFSTPISVYNGLRALINNLSPIILGLFATTVIVGNYGVALKTVNILWLIIDALSLSILPMFASTFAIKKLSKQISKFYNNSIALTFMVMVPVLFYIAVLSKQFSYTAFSAKYLLAPLYLSIISIGILLWVIATYTVMLLIAANKTRKLMKYSMAIAIMEIILMLLLVPWLSGTGLLLILFIISPTVLSILSVKAIKSELNLDFDLGKIVRIVIAGIIGAAFLVPLMLILSENYILVLAMGAVVQIVIYPVILMKLKGVVKEDLDSLKNISKKLPVANKVIELFVNYSERFI
jgi:O-antigen/teichoic acid export membrane protein